MLRADHPVPKLNPQKNIRERKPATLLPCAVDRKLLSVYERCFVKGLGVEVVLASPPQRTCIDAEGTLSGSIKL